MSSRKSLGLVLVVFAAALLFPLAAGATSAVPRCGNADLHAGYRYGDSGAGHTFGWIVLKNTAKHACTAGGFSGISYVGHGNGTQVGAPATWERSRWRTYTLQPGQRLREPVSEARAQNYAQKTCKPIKVDGFRIYVPGSTTSQFVEHTTTGCANANVHLLTTKALTRP